MIVNINNLLWKISIYSAKKAEIGLLLMEKKIILEKYMYYADVFLKNLAKILLKKIGANEHTIKLKEYKQLFYGLMFSLAIVEF